jgi:AraC-like DNA-binding protein
MESQALLINDMLSQINERGLMHIEGVSRIPTHEKQFLSPFILICLTHRGWSKAVYNLRPFEFRPHELTVIPPGYVLIARESSDDYLASLLVIDPKFLKKLNFQHALTHDQLEHLNNSAFHLNEEQYEVVLGCFRILNAISQINHPNRDELIASQLEIAAQLIASYMEENGVIKTRGFTAAQQLVNRFQDAVVKHYVESRKVEFYADLLCLSPKYFGSIIKEQTGITASVWITRYVITKAKALLHYRKDLSIQQISFRLGLPDPAAFTRYFKASTGLSPKAYREQATKLS